MLKIWRVWFLMLLLSISPLGLAKEGTVNINTADATKIAATLEGVGPKKAEAIVDYRKAHGEFKTLEDVKKVPGMGEKTVEKNKNKIKFADEAAASPPTNPPPTPSTNPPPTSKK